MSPVVTPWVQCCPQHAWQEAQGALEARGSSEASGEGSSAVSAAVHVSTS